MNKKQKYIINLLNIILFGILVIIIIAGIMKDGGVKAFIRNDGSEGIESYTF